ncbi:MULTISPECIES: cytochrome C oxidase subunit IV family protein [unclassified Marinobacter]|jgi:heme/copper-type cytochrome/quinol oxidase subunit 4|uniref:cytochrome C oxidase subunit IV family protein n=1 Tax=unclassified Marinobacter TaxID=83889 RepID=UPI00200D110E|nr:MULTISPECIES: cytochrome C oxidase subunit IV family protein [unclassified Marinobacter]UQG55238.1 cytochrome C oxidase subunit IV family protein [Marinobacter sp. M4C]UQG64041.1 cytochrome C oxidase subunit IV family protein [Marinobacter sp. M2C]UQG68325.1 cytochrome C oxidase subunit IV family protein [Marinobacter sp. M1C]
MLAVYFALMICTALPVIALKAGISPEFLAWLVFGMVIVKSLLLVDHFMGMKKAPRGWRVAAQLWAPVVIVAVAGFHAIT